MPTAKEVGRYSALQVLGVPREKVALFNRRLHIPYLDPEPSTAERVAPYAAAGAAALPFAGLIGQKPIIHDPFTNENIRRVRNMQELEGLAQPGDVYVATTAGNPNANPFKSTQAAQGSEFFHAGTVLSPERAGGPVRATPESNWLTYEDTIPRMRDLGEHAVDQGVVLLRPREALKAKELAGFEREVTRRAKLPYDFNQDVLSWLRDLVIPKIPGAKWLGGRATRRCAGNICSTTPAMALHDAAGREVVPHVQPQNVMPADWLRSPNYEAVAAHMTPEAEALARTPLQRTIGKIAPRLALGGALAGGTYLAAKDPTNLALPAGVVAAPLAARQIARLYHAARGTEGGAARAARYAVPDVNMSLFNMIGSEDPKKLRLLRNITRRSIPLAVGGGVGALLLAKHLKNKYRDKSLTERLGIA